MNVLLLGGGLQALSFGESLYQQCRLFVISDEYAIRRSCFFYRVYPSWKSDTSRLINTILSEQQIDVIVPMSDKYASFLSKHKIELQRSYPVKCAVPDYDILSIVENKSSFMRFCERQGIPHPKTVSVSQRNIEDAIRIVGFPALIKPDVSVGARGITRVDNQEGIEKILPVIEKEYGACSLQEFVDNPEYYYNVMIYRDSLGCCVNSTIIKILRMYPVKGGSSSYCVSVRDDKLLSICVDVLEKLDWVGIADLDVLQQKDSGEYRVIEINPRVPASLRAAYISGVNFPKLIVDNCCGNRTPSYKYMPGKKLRYMGLDIMWLLHSPQRWRSFFAWFRFYGKELYYQDIFIRDRSTWYSWLVTGLRKLIVH